MTGFSKARIAPFDYDEDELARELEPLR